MFLGLGLPWVIAAQYSSANNTTYEVPAGDLSFSVILFLITSILCFVVLLVRRCVSATFDFILLFIGRWRRTWRPSILEIFISWYLRTSLVGICHRSFTEGIWSIRGLQRMILN